MLGHDPNRIVVGRIKFAVFDRNIFRISSINALETFIEFAVVYFQVAERTIGVFNIEPNRLIVAGGVVDVEYTVIESKTINDSFGA